VRLLVFETGIGLVLNIANTF